MYRGQISVRKEEMEGFIRVAETLQVQGLLKCRESLKVFSDTRDPPPPHSDHTYTYSPNSRSRVSRTQFTGHQIKVLQEQFEKNNYCDPAKLEYLARKLDLNHRVIQVWFQNARQKTRKIQEKQTRVESGNSHYECKKCLEQFQTYLDLIIHQVQPCQEEEGEEEIINIVVPDCETGNQGQYQYQSSRASTNSDCVPPGEIALPDQLEQLLEQFEQFSEKIREDQLAPGTTKDLMERDENENNKVQGGAEDCEPGGLVIDEAQVTSRPGLRIVNVKSLQPAEWNTAGDSLSATGELLNGEIILFDLLMLKSFSS